ncbi:GPI transamidase subunit PIG-U-domain-containing protein [Suillus subalutaceus]|uniref:GPI transamidase subunit PIG-U-domain-containing protein n=1 Tax=Suillus subalutaceus TaxID=48586 RepID=UPI001B866684|nr:GPI transamidase subunit PIG-U-domain-containing protein [Suillus subalutaceus]KAG1841695.1 GPI transamidase subunit PIG-U-domain-containing protein [Suillus subalutaceus]
MNISPTFLVLVCLRFLLAVLPLPGRNLLKHDHQLSSPLTSYLHLNEGLWLLDNNIDPYMGGTFHHSPLLLSLFSTIVPPLPVVWAVSDGIGAWALLCIWRARQGLSFQKGTKSNVENLIVSVYLLNPYLLLPSLALSTSTFENTFTLLALMFASQGKVSSALLAIAFAVHLTPSSILLLLPILMVLLSSPVSNLASPRPFHGSLKRIPFLFGEFTLYWLVLVGAACIITGGNWNWVRASWGASLTLPDLTPNPGLWWYFFTEMFDHFRPFFLMVFSVHLVIYIFPICIKFQHDPLYAAFLLVGVLGTFKAYLNFRHPIITILLHLHAALLLPLQHVLWVSEGRGNANFYYAASLVMGMAGGAGLVDACWAGMRIAVGDAKVWAEEKVDGEKGKGKVVWWEVVQQ